VCHVRSCDLDGVEQRPMRGPDETKVRLEWLCERHLSEFDDFHRSGDQARRID
jgi:hypothetical protein